MRNNWRWACVLSLLILIATPCWAETVWFGGPVDDGFFALGWSTNGNRLAFGWFEVTHMISNGSSITVMVQDLVTDEVLWKVAKRWDQGNVGDGSDDHYPSTAPEAWQYVADEANGQLARLGIKEAASATPDSFPYSNGDQINVEVKTEDGKTPYEIWAVSEKLGRKMISSGDKDDVFMEIRPEGYFLSPDGSRMAVVLHMFPNMPFTYYQVIGCHLRAGFKK